MPLPVSRREAGLWGGLWRPWSPAGCGLVKVPDGHLAVTLGGDSSPPCCPTPRGSLAVETPRLGVLGWLPSGAPGPSSRAPLLTRPSAAFRTFRAGALLRAIHHWNYVLSPIIQ